MSYRKCKFLFPVITVALLFLATGGSYALGQSGGTTTRVSVSSEGTQADGGSYWASISADGRYIAFLSWASNLVIGDVNNYQDIFIHDWQTGDTVLVSVASNGAQANSNSFHPSISADGVFRQYRKTHFWLFENLLRYTQIWAKQVRGSLSSPYLAVVPTETNWHAIVTFAVLRF